MWHKKKAFANGMVALKPPKHAFVVAIVAAACNFLQV